MADLLTRARTALSDRYRIERALGSGGMAIVYLAEDVRHRRKVAVKVLRPEFATGLGSDRFLREIEIAAGLTHPHILTVHDSGEAAGLLYYVMPYVQGESLRDRLRRETQLPLGEALRIAREVADALHYAHRQDIVHRDIKPENILLEEGHAVVADFGIARAVSAAGGRTLTQTGAVVGTPDYMSPEQAMGGGGIDGRTDIYSLGCVLYEMLVGRAPSHWSDRGTLAQGRLSVAPPEDARPLREAPPAVQGALAKALALAPSARFTTAQDFAKALTPSTARWGVLPGRRSFVMAGIVAILLLGAAVATWWTSTGRSAPLSSERVLVTGFENQTGDSSLAVIGLLVADWLTRGLQETGLIQVIDARAVATDPGWALRAGPAAAAAARELARSVGAGTVVSGAYYRHADSLQFQAQLTDARTGRLLYSAEPVLGAPEAPLDAVEVLRQRVSGAVASLVDQTWPATSFRPPSYDAYREYVAAVPLIGRQDFGGAIAGFLRAAAIDTGFTLPLIYAAVLMIETGQYAAADSMLGVATRFRDRVRAPEGYMLQYLAARLRGDLATQLTAMRRISDVAPLSEATWELAQLLLRHNHPREAIAVLDRLDPRQGFLQNWWFYWNASVAAYHMLGEDGTALDAARRGRQQYPDHPGAASAEIMPLAALGRVEELTQRVDEGMTLAAPGAVDPLPPMWRRTEAAVELRAHGHGDAAAAMMERVRRWALDRPREAEATVASRVHLALIAYLDGHWDDADTRFRALADEFPDDVNYQGYLGTIAARRGDRAEALRTADWLANLTQPYLFGLHQLWRARIAALLGEPEQAVGLLRSAINQGVTYFGTGHVLWISRTDLAWLHRDVDFESLSDYPLFQELARPKG